jgi:hypothetical protein
MVYVEPRSWRGVLDTTLCDKFVSNLRQVGAFLRALRFPPPKPEVILTNFFAEPTVLLVPIISRDYVRVSSKEIY